MEKTINLDALPWYPHVDDEGFIIYTDKLPSNDEFIY